MTIERDITTEADDAADAVRANPCFTDGTPEEALDFLDAVITSLNADRDALSHEIERGH